MTGRRILIADDDRLILSTLGQGLRDAGYEVLEASDGNGAVHLCESSSHPDLAILDVRMPNLSGVEAARQIRRNTDVPCIFLSAYSDMDVVREAIAEGALGYMVKPVDIPKIIPAIEAALARASDIRTLRDSERSMNTSLNNGREINMAVGVLMERYRLNRNLAFNVLRQEARSNRVKIHETAKQLLDAADTLNLPREILPKISGSTPSTE